MLFIDMNYYAASLNGNFYEKTLLALLVTILVGVATPTALA